MCLFINFDVYGILLISLIENKPALKPSSKSWLLYAISSEIEAICASNDGAVSKIILLLKKSFFKIDLYGLIFLTGPLCFIKPSNVSSVRFKPLNL